ncbi:hypothetical protein NERG_01528 [Nematocida ausubeli]|uniref:Uncharacterized protein n=1 Tax=Nematocida ausubeli (strain ATCC PRA-371 / ERTm2) TaxID=1913371 RepID=H8ZD57_NEMA1|nr:hypothetical protein NERG_01528 [Nematocida ausubeli]
MQNSFVIGSYTVNKKQTKDEEDCSEPAELNFIPVKNSNSTIPRAIYILYSMYFIFIGYMYMLMYGSLTEEKSHAFNGSPNVFRYLNTCMLSVTASFIFQIIPCKNITDNIAREKTIEISTRNTWVFLGMALYTVGKLYFKAGLIQIAFNLQYLFSIAVGLSSLIIFLQNWFLFKLNGNLSNLQPTMVLLLKISICLAALCAVILRIYNSYMNFNLVFYI